jgi:hypothetical protein
LDKVASIFCASSEEMPYFFTKVAIGHLPPLDLCCVLIIRAVRAMEATLPILQNHLAEMAVPVSSSAKLAVKHSFRHQR